MNKPVLLYNFLIIFSINLALCQSFGLNTGFGLGLNPTGSSMLLNLEGNAGHAFGNQQYLYGGIKGLFYPFRSVTSTASLETTAVIAPSILTGYRYLLPSYVRKDNGHTRGFYVDGRLYFSPYLPRHIIYENDQSVDVSVKGDYKVQFAYGLSLGWYFTSPDGDSYSAIQLEYNTLDPFEVLRTLDFPNRGTLPGDSMILLSLYLFKW